MNRQTGQCRSRADDSKQNKNYKYRYSGLTVIPNSRLLANKIRITDNKFIIKQALTVICMRHKSMQVNNAHFASAVPIMNFCRNNYCLLFHLPDSPLHGVEAVFVDSFARDEIANDLVYVENFD